MDHTGHKLSGNNGWLSPRTALNMHAANMVNVFRSLDDAEESWRLFEIGAPTYPFQTFGFARMAFETVGRSMGQRPFIIASSQAVLPLAIRYKYGLRILEFLGTDINDYNVPLVRPGIRIADLAYLWECALQQARPDLVQIDHQPDCMADGQPNLFLCIYPVSSFFENAHVATIGPTYFADRSSRHFFREARRKLHQLERAFPDVVFEPAEVSDIEVCLEQRRPKYPYEHAHAAAYRAAYKAMASLPCGRFYRLRAGSIVLATNLCLVHQQRLYGRLMSYNQDHAFFSPGRALLMRVMEHAIAEGVTALDLSIGDIAYKTHWCDRTRPTYYSRYPVSLLGRLAKPIQDRVRPYRPSASSIPG